MEIAPTGAVLIHAERRTDMTGVVGAFRDYANAPNYLQNYVIKLCSY
jgi:hypothetical protein